jgi:hypothetical protein
MKIKLVALVLLCLMSGTAMAQEPKVTSLMSKDLTENPGRDVLMITLLYEKARWHLYSTKSLDPRPRACNATSRSFAWKVTLRPVWCVFSNR